jgi:hypothetical protein
MTALVTVESGKMFLIDVQANLLTSMDIHGKPIVTRCLQRVPLVVPGCSVTFTCSDGMDTDAGKVVHVLYSQ